VDDELKNPIDESPEASPQPPESEPTIESEAISLASPVSDGAQELVEPESQVRPLDEGAPESSEELEPSVPAESPAPVIREETEPAAEAGERKIEEPSDEAEPLSEPDEPVLPESPAPAIAEQAEAVPEDDQPAEAPATPAEPPAVVAEEAPSEEEVVEPKSENMQWYILKVQSNREDSIRQGLERRVKIAGLERYFGDVIVPIEKVTEVKGGRKRVIKRKLYPGYLVIQMEINDDTWFLVRETPGIGDFTGAAGRPTPMLDHEVARIVSTQEEKADAAPKLKIGFKLGDRVKINEGTFENFEGEVETIDEASGRVTVMINIFGRSTPVELEYWQVESL